MKRIRPRVDFVVVGVVLIVLGLITLMTMELWLPHPGLHVTSQVRRMIGA